MRIKQLPESVYSRIAAGEVIDRPASVVRELIDNSVDAGASSIIIKTVGGGIDEISVTDNGCGIDREDLMLALTEHATSKIFDVDDIYNITTFGFRGEALNSIKTVAKIEIISNTDESGLSSGYSINNDDYQIRAVPYNKGTKITVSDLFYNMPARKKFLKSKITELNNVKKVIKDKILANLNVAVKYYNDNKLIFSSSGDGDFAAAFKAINDMNDEISNLEIHSHRMQISDDLSIGVYFSSPEVFFTNRKYQNLFVNNRPVSVSFFYAMIDIAIRDYVSPGRHPLIYAFVDISPKLIDVNIHPAKKEINFADPSSISQSLAHVIRVGMGNVISRKITVSEAVSEDMSFADKRFSVNLFEPEHSAESPSRITQLFNPNYQNFSLPDNNDVIIDENVDYRIVGRIFNTYILVERDNRMLIIDQHAAAESIIYRKKLAKYESDKASEMLVIPMVVDLSEWNVTTESKIAALSNAGFDIEHDEGTTIVIRAVPHVLMMKKDTDMVIDLIKKSLESEIIEDKSIIQQVLIQASCREAIKKGDFINLLEMSEIVKMYFEYGITNCPHGRPAHFELDITELDKYFQRRK